MTPAVVDVTIGCLPKRFFGSRAPARRGAIENFFGKLKEFKRIAMRADKTDQSFASMIHFVAAVINSR